MFLVWQMPSAARAASGSLLYPLSYGRNGAAGRIRTFDLGVTSDKPNTPARPRSFAAPVRYPPRGGIQDGRWKFISPPCLGTAFGPAEAIAPYRARERRCSRAAHADCGMVPFGATFGSSSRRCAAGMTARGFVLTTRRARACPISSFAVPRACHGLVWPTAASTAALPCRTARPAGSDEPAPPARGARCIPIAPVVCKRNVRRRAGKTKSCGRAQCARNGVAVSPATPALLLRARAAL